MANTIKEAADSLLKKGNITQEEYDSINIEKVGAFNLKKFLDAVGGELSEKAPNVFFKHLTSDIPNAASSIAGDIAGDAAKGAFKDLTRSRLLENSLKKNPKFAKEYVKLVSGDIKSDAFKDAMKNPQLVEQLGQNLTKKNLFDRVKGLNLWMAPAAAGAAVVAKEGIVDPLMQESKARKSFGELSKYTPQLAEADQEKMRDYFNVIKTYSPHAASNPLVAGAIVNKMMEFGGVDHKLIQDLTNIQSNRPNLESIKTMVGGGIGSMSKYPKED